MASSTRAAQFIKALTRSAWRVVGRKTSPKASAVGESEFRNFFNHGVTEVNTVKQSTTVTSVRSYGYKVLWENKRVDACGAEAARSWLSGPVLLG